MKIEININFGKMGDWFKQFFSKEKWKGYLRSFKIYLKDNPKKSITFVLMILILWVGYCYYLSTLPTTYYCIDKYKTYKKLKKEIQR